MLTAFENPKLCYFDEVENLLKIDSLLIAYIICPVDQTPITFHKLMHLHVYSSLYLSDIQYMFRINVYYMDFQSM